ncbi:cell wall hydrolase [Clostridium rectalis]|uniref:cell wall hydrolase n=1 Tax=Clostridium rectalis TaxID=2040295 RepID=UPI000F633F01|nr:cell wall hydrolase [Clostridium rectalis]
MTKKNLLCFFIFLFVLLNGFTVKAGVSLDVDSDLFNSDPKTVQVLSHSNGKVYITDKDVNLMAKVVYAESCGEPYEGKVAVASVILNRVKDPSFPKSIEGVVKQRNAFSCVINGEIKANPDDACYKAVVDALNGKDPTNKSVFFYNPKIATSKWMKNIDKKNIKSIGNHVFFIIR